MNVNPNGPNPDPFAQHMAALAPLNVNPAPGGQAGEEPPPAPVAAAANLAQHNPFAPDALAQPALPAGPAQQAQQAPESPPAGQIIQAPQHAPGAPRRAQGMAPFDARLQQRRILNFDALPPPQIPFHLQGLPVAPHLLAPHAAVWLGLIQQGQPEPVTPSGASTQTQAHFSPPSVRKP